MAEAIEVSVRVRYAETDAMGVAHHTSYLIWFEEARSEYFRQLGGDYARLEEAGFHLPVAELSCRYLAPARYGDRLLIRTVLESVQSRSLSFSYEVLREETREVLARGHTKHICIDDQGRACSLPQCLRDMLTACR